MDSFNYVIGVITLDYFRLNILWVIAIKILVKNFLCNLSKLGNYIEPFLKWKCIYRYNVTCYMYFVLSEKSDNYRIN